MHLCTYTYVFTYKIIIIFIGLGAIQIGFSSQKQVWFRFAVIDNKMGEILLNLRNIFVFYISTWNKTYLFVKRNMVCETFFYAQCVCRDLNCDMILITCGEYANGCL